MPNLKFLASTVPEIWRGSQNFKSWSRDPFAIAFDVFCTFSIVPPVLNLSVKYDVNIFIGDQYMVILLLCRFGCDMTIPPMLGMFLGVWFDR